MAKELIMDKPRRLCACGRVTTSAGYDAKGYRRYKNKCETCRFHAYRHFKKDHCELCGFVAVHSSQLDVDHIDGNHANNDESNLQTLCANCHRLKTYMKKDYMPKTGTDNG